MRPEQLPLIGLARRRPFLLATALVALLVAVVDGSRVLTINGPQLMARFPADDTFYYLELARNFPTPEFVEGISTTGFHPLYWLVLSPIAALFDGIAATRATLLLNVVFHAAIGVGIFYVTRLRWRESVAALTAIVWLVVPVTRETALMGLETMLALTCLVALASACSGNLSRRRLILIGLLLGAAFLARLDSLLITVPLVAAVVWTKRRDLHIKDVTTAVGAALVVALPWLIFLVANGSSLSTDSSRALRILRDQDGVGFDNFVPTVELMYQNANRFISREVFPTDIGTWQAIAFIFTLVVAALVARRRTSVSSLEVGLTIGTLVLFATYALILGGTRPWYFGYWQLWLCLLVVPVVATVIVSLVEGKEVANRCGVALLSVVVVTITFSTLQPNFAQERDKYLAAVSVGAEVSPDAVLASFNSGIYGYFIEQPMINLDGVVNPDVHEALEDKSLCSYMRERRVTYFLDEPGAYQELLRFAPEVKTSEPIVVSDKWGEVVQKQVLSKVDTSSCSS